MRGLRRAMEKILIWPDCDGGRKSRSIDRRCVSGQVWSVEACRRGVGRRSGAEVRCLPRGMLNETANKSE